MTVYCMGEALIDFTPERFEDNEVISYRKNVGGAPLNVATSIARLGESSSFLSQLSKDSFGQYIYGSLRENGVLVDRLDLSSSYKTGLAFVNWDENRNRSFSFYRKDAADLMYSREDFSFFTREDILHFCSVNLVDSKAKLSHKRAIEEMRRKGGLVSFDPNLRFNLWEDQEELYQTVNEFLSGADLVKIADDELFFITRKKDEKEAFNYLFDQDISLIVYTQGEKGISLISRENSYFGPAYSLDVVDTTGAGDASIGAFLYNLSKDKIGKDDLVSYVDKNHDYLLSFSNGVAGLTTTKVGALDGLPYLKEVKDLLENK